VKYSINRHLCQSAEAKQLFLFFVLIFLISFCNLHSQSLEFKQVKSGYSYKSKNPGSYVVRNLADWKTLWKECISDKETLPTIDFTNEIVIAVFRAVCPTAEFGIAITKISAVNKDLLVEIINSNPSDNCRRTMDPTKPYAIYRMKKTNLVMYFKESTIIKSCD
jgi:hypothetical protein